MIRKSFFLVLFAGWVVPAFCAPQRYGQLPDFDLLERSGESLTLEDIQGKPWVVNFIFTRCQGPCPLLTQKMARLQKDLPEDAGLLSFTVDPEYDTPQVLSVYAEEYGADPARWLFATGDERKVREILRNGFHIGAEPNSEAQGEGDAFIHSQKFVLVDSQGGIRGYYDGEDPQDLSRIAKDLQWLKFEAAPPWVRRLPTVNAGLNALCALFLFAGYRFIRAKAVSAHQWSMSAAFCVSILFLSCYLLYHYRMGSIPFRGLGSLRTAYFSLLLSHTVLAALIVPLALVTLYRAWKKDFIGHKAIARWAYPVWMYVSVSGVAVYWMLYRM